MVGIKKLRLLSACVTMAVMFTGCASGSGGTQTGSAGGTNNGATATQSGSSSKTDASSGTSLKPAELTVAFFTLSSQTKGIPEVEAAINKITKEKINATVKLLPISFGSYVQQLNLMNASGEKLDLLVGAVQGGPSYNNMVSTGQIVPLNDLLDKYGQGIKEAMGPFLDATKIGGKIYAIPRNSDLAQGYGIAMRKDLIDKHHIDITKIKSLDDLTPVFKTIKENEPGVTPFVEYAPGGSAFVPMGTFNLLGDGLGALQYGGDEKKVVNIYETDAYAKQLKRIREWYQAGYIQKDAATTKDIGNDLIKANRAFSYFTNLKPGYDVQASKQAGTEMVSVQLVKPVLEQVTSFSWSVSKNSKDQDRAVMLLNLMYADKDLINLLDWGIEGRDYVKVQGKDNIIKYPDGTSATTVPYGLNTGWLFGNQLKSYVFEGDDPNVWKQMDDFNKNAVKSLALGFTYDNTPVKNETAAVTNVLKQYKIGIETGTLDPDATLPQFIKKLKDAGIDTIVAEKQKQFDEWLKTK
ncbi:ABC transporter substrate-binding protein [Paenibacillus aestuarii]|uniref:ABC transporter substrate-binding protein n=1 Tax=Paenibacillus aestuarii TaxID=516965 RepID=A0ABW0KAQ2_9BACL|nr:ABC transporter substrate-binding protein [Paenibacillus aestuarii]